MKRASLRPKPRIDADLEAARREVHDRARWHCERCGTVSGYAEVHHRKGRQGPDPHRLSNLVLLCSDCHRWAHAHPLEAYATGWCIRRLGGDEPDEVPMVTTGGHVFGLAEEGHVIDWPSFAYTDQPHSSESE